MYSGSDVQIIRNKNDTTQDEFNTSMAGLSDVSIGDVQR